MQLMQVITWDNGWKKNITNFGESTISLEHQTYMQWDILIFFSKLAKNIVFVK